jgi:alkylation response protein AidB-like acyl-CoA dehydrogenase
MIRDPETLDILLDSSARFVRGIGAQDVLINGMADQKQRYLPQLASGAITGSSALISKAVQA